MNKKLSGAKTVLVPITKVGKNYIPFVEDLKNRTIKYIDIFFTLLLPDTEAEGVTAYTNTPYITLADITGNAYLINNRPVDDFLYTKNLGIRPEINSKLSLQNSFILNNDEDAIGKYYVLVFWYDLPEFSARNRKDTLVTDYISVPVPKVLANTLPNEERFAGKRFRYILFSMVDTTPEGTTGISDDDEINSLYLTLQKGSYKVLENVPLRLFYQAQMFDKMEFANIIFDMQNSFIKVGGAGRLYINEKSVFLNLVYEKE